MFLKRALHKNWLNDGCSILDLIKEDFLTACGNQYQFV